MNRIRVFTSGALLAFACYCMLFDRNLPFSLPFPVYAAAFLYFSVFPIKDMLSFCNTTLYKGRQFEKNYDTGEESAQVLLTEKRSYDRRAAGAMLFWLTFLAIPGYLYCNGLLDRIWIFLLFTLSNFSVFFAIFGWCPFHSIFIRPDCCMECRIYNWDSFFQYSFLIFFPNVFTLTLVLLGVLSLIVWEIRHALHPERFYKCSNARLTCENCDLDGCRKHKKKLFHKTLKEEYRNK